MLPMGGEETFDLSIPPRASPALWLLNDHHVTESWFDAGRRLGAVWVLPLQQRLKNGLQVAVSVIADSRAASEQKAISHEASADPKLLFARSDPTVLV
ncbi:hypothetical protein NXC24_PC01602 (plasmid) [Rhizobium sp. NXC24]|nr:hypothetical protein NXC24_PC01602 [Rhizobium sp. NXC24]